MEKHVCIFKNILADADTDSCIFRSCLSLFECMHKYEISGI